MEQESSTKRAVEELLGASSIEDCIRVVVNTLDADGTEAPDKDPAQICRDLAKKFNHMPHGVTEQAQSRLDVLYHGKGVARFAVQLARDDPNHGSSSELRSRRELLIAVIPPGNGTPDGSRVLSLWDFVREYQDALREAWENERELPAFPLAPLCKWLVLGAQEVKRNGRPDPLCHGAIVLTRRASAQHLEEASVASHSIDQAHVYLPRLAPGQVDGEYVENYSLPLKLLDWTAAEPGRSTRGAPLHGRMFSEAILDVRKEHWDLSATEGILLPPQPLGEYLRRFYTLNSVKRWDKSRVGPLLRAFAVLEDMETRIPWEDPETGDGGARRVVVPVDIPRTGSLRDYVRFMVCLPPLKTLKGSLVDRSILQIAGRKSAPAWRLVLMLSAFWNWPGPLRAPIPGGTGWAQRKKWEQYDVLTERQLVAMAFPQEPAGISNSGYRSRVQRTKEALEYLVRLGFAEVLEERRGKRRIRPGPEWVGWRGNPPKSESEEESE